MNKEYEYKLNAANPQVATINLKEQVLGGNDALIFTSKLEELCSKKVKFVIADLSGVELMNSSGLGMMVSGLSTLRKHEINFILASVPVRVNNLLEMTHLNNVFKIFDSVSSAEEDCIKNL
jgi:anti-sigma B factor antagonist